MDVNSVKTLLEQRNGIILTQDAVNNGISRQELAYLAKNGILERASRGVYTSADSMDDPLYTIQVQARKIIYSHETALFLHRMTDRTPERYTVTVPSSYKPSEALRNKCAVYYIKPELLSLGAVSLPSGMGHTVTAYDKERTLCDIVRSRNRIDEQIFLDALKQYVSQSDKDLNRLADYAKHLGVFKLVTQYLEVLL
jgi:predicted transcriptional regulator of viral defense system